MLKSTKFLAVLLLCALIPLTASATVTRVIGLGGFGANYVVKDAFNPTLWPQTIIDYPNLAGGEFYTEANGFQFQKAYINYDFGESNTLQFSLDQLPGLRSSLDSRFTYTGLNGLAVNPLAGNNANKLSIIYGRRLGDLKFGLALAYAGRGMETKGTGTSEKASESVIGLQVGLSAMEDKLDLALGFESVGFSHDLNGTTDLENDGSMGLRVLGRYWWNYADNTALVPHLQFWTMKDAGKAGANGQSVTTTSIRLGAGHNWTPKENMLALFEFGIELNSEKYEATPANAAFDRTEGMNSLPYWRLGFESTVFNWLNGRFGAERAWVSQTNDLAPTEPSSNYSQTNLYLGATTHWNRLILDLLVEPAFLSNGPNFVSGNVTAPLFSRISLKYDFNN